MQEQDLGIRVTRTVQTNKSNKITFKRFSTTLEVKKPTYNEVKNEAFKHDTLYNKLKTNYAAKVGHLGVIWGHLTQIFRVEERQN